MPSRKLTDRCPRCSCKNQLRARYCGDCGCALNPDRAGKAEDGRVKLYADIAHPINSDCREMIQRLVIAAYIEEVERAKQPGYICMYDDFGEENYASLDEETEALLHLSPRLGMQMPTPPEKSTIDAALHRREVILRSDLSHQEIEPDGDRLRGFSSPVSNWPGSRQTLTETIEAGGAAHVQSSRDNQDGGEGFGAGLV